MCCYLNPRDLIIQMSAAAKLAADHKSPLGTGPANWAGSSRVTDKRQVAIDQLDQKEDYRVHDMKEADFGRKVSHYTTLTHTPPHATQRMQPPPPPHGDQISTGYDGFGSIRNGVEGTKGNGRVMTLSCAFQIILC